MNILSKVTDEMQGVLTQSADEKAIETGFMKRKRKITGSKFIQTLVFGWLRDLEGIHSTTKGIMLALTYL